MMMDITSLVDEGFRIGMLQHREEAIGLASFLAGQDVGSFMEIGSWKGGMFKVLCGLSDPRGPKVSIDLDAYGDLPGTMAERNDMMRSWSPLVSCIVGDSHSQETQKDVYLLLRGLSPECRGPFRPGICGTPLDFLMIDGDHSYEGCKQDYEMYSPLVNPGGWIAFHDINDTPKHRASGCMVSQLWQELYGEKIEISLRREWGGIGLIRKCMDIRKAC